MSQTANSTPEILVEVRDLQVHFGPEDDPVRAVDGVSFSIPAGRTVALVGESGSGKSVTALSLAKLVPTPPARYMGGSVKFEGREILSLEDRELRQIRGNRISYIFQEPMVSLNPVFRVGYQIAEAIRLHRPGVDVHQEVLNLLELVGIPDPARRCRSYPHEMSGGMQQRVMIAMALACRPKLLVADEPTTALDVTIQAQILDLLRELQQKLNMAVLLITHNLGVVAGNAHEVHVMQNGKIVEHGPTRDVLRAPSHPYTKALLDAVPRLRGPMSRLLGAGARLRGEDGTSDIRRIRSDFSAPAPVPRGHPLLEARDIKVTFGRGESAVKALKGVSVKIEQGESVGLVGESGCGKTTLGRTLIRLLDPDEGTVLYRGQDILGLKGSALLPFRRKVQIVFQDPFGSLNPRMSIGNALAEVLKVHRIGTPADRRDRVGYLLSAVGLDPAHMVRYPHEFSGGQRQRIGIARALALGPDVIIADEPVSALDVSVQAEILNLLKDLKQEFGLSLLFIAHDLAVVRYVCDKVYVMYGGEILESGVPDDVYADPKNEYTRRLLSAVPDVLAQ